MKNDIHGYLIYAAQIYLLICMLFLAGKDATSYKLKDQNRSDGSLQTHRIQRWHRDGVVLWILFTIQMMYFVSLWTGLYSLLIRISVFDPAFNQWAGLRAGLLGGTAWSDRFFVKVFGQYGALKKMIVFLLLIIILNFIIHV